VIHRLLINLTPFIFSNPIPFIPFPLIRGRGISYIREALPPFDSPFKDEEKRDFFDASLKERGKGF
jgi:hypothetical protein